MNYIDELEKDENVEELANSLRILDSRISKSEETLDNIRRHATHQDNFDIVKKVDGYFSSRSLTPTLNHRLRWANNLLRESRNWLPQEPHSGDWDTPLGRLLSDIDYYLDSEEEL